MKLVEILARDLGEWPEGMVHLIQMSDRWVYGSTCVKRDVCDYSRDMGDDFGTRIKRVEYAHDYTTAIVTREQWEAARNPASRDPVLGVPREPRASPEVGSAYHALVDALAERDRIIECLEAQIAGLEDALR